MDRQFWIVFVGTICFCIFSHVTLAQEENVAVGKPTDQNQSLNFSGFVWSANKSVDNCTNATSPETSMCCSASQGGAENYWLVDLEDQYIVTRIVVIGRDDGSGNQLTGFTVFIEETSGGTETQIYDNTGITYGNGTFVITLNNRLVSTVIIRRPSGTIITLCEVQVFAVGMTTDNPMETSDSSTDDVSMMTSMDPGMTQSTDSDVTMDPDVTMDSSVTMSTDGSMTSNNDMSTSMPPNNQDTTGNKGTKHGIELFTLLLAAVAVLYNIYKYHN